MTDRLASVWESLLNAFLGRNAAKTVDACARYWGRVVKVSGANVDVQLDTAAIPSPSGVPLAVGLPATSVTLQGGERVLVGFRNGDPSQPFAELFEQASTVTDITIGQTSAAGAARIGDPIRTGILSVDTAVVGGVTVVTKVSFNGTPITADGTHLTGTITDGSHTVFIGV